MLECSIYVSIPCPFCISCKSYFYVNIVLPRHRSVIQEKHIFVFNLNHTFQELLQIYNLYISTVQQLNELRFCGLSLFLNKK